MTNILLDFLGRIVTCRMRAANNADQMILNLVVDRNFTKRLAKFDDLGACRNGVNLRRRDPGGPIQDFRKFVVTGKIDVELEKETIELGFR